MFVEERHCFELKLFEFPLHQLVEHEGCTDARTAQSKLQAFPG